MLQPPWRHQGNCHCCLHKLNPCKLAFSIWIPGRTWSNTDSILPRHSSLPQQLEWLLRVCGIFDIRFRCSKHTLTISRLACSSFCRITRALVAVASIASADPQSGSMVTGDRTLTPFSPGIPAFNMSWNKFRLGGNAQLTLLYSIQCFEINDSSKTRAYARTDLS